jgi:cellulose synthase/poly-beta-1,6-N-acetylglucosamine synthase-like glycosyltransferase
MSEPRTAPGLEPSLRLPGLSVFLPCHNEADNLVRVVDNFRGQLDRFAEAYEIIIVDDGSRRNRGIADKSGGRDAHIKVDHAVNRGYGSAVISVCRRQPCLTCCCVTATGSSTRRRLHGS